MTESTTDTTDTREAATTLRHRWLDGPDSGGLMPATEAEWAAIDTVLTRNGWMALNRTLSRILVAEDEDGTIVGFSVIQLMPHLGPLHVDKSLRGTGLADQLATATVQYMLDSQARGWMVIADSPHSERLAKAQGMTKLQSPVYIAGMGTSVAPPAPPAPSDKVIH